MNSQLIVTWINVIYIYIHIVQLSKDAEAIKVEEHTALPWPRTEGPVKVEDCPWLNCMATEGPSMTWRRGHFGYEMEPQNSQNFDRTWLSVRSRSARKSLEAARYWRPKLRAWRSKQRTSLDMAYEGTYRFTSSPLPRTTTRSSSRSGLHVGFATGIAIGQRWQSFYARFRSTGWCTCLIF